MSMPVNLRRIYLVGLMGAGKSTVGKILAALLKWDFLEIDQAVETFAGKSITEIFETEGEHSFRKLESKILRDTLDLNRVLIDCGGGIVTQAENLSILKSETVVWLELTPADAAARVAHTRNRPLLKGCESTVMELSDVLADRQDAYAEVAAIRINSGGISPEIVASNILKELGQAHA